MNESMRGHRRAGLVLLLLLCGNCVADSGAGKSPAQSKVLHVAASAQHAAAVNPLRNAYFGDLHVHTSDSPDAYLYGVRVTPEDAYRFARGEEIEHVSHATGRKIRIDRPLDFMAVTDHAEYMGVLSMMADPASPLSGLPLSRQILSSDLALSNAAFTTLAESIQHNQPIVQLVKPVERKSIWQSQVAVADRHYQPGIFTTMIGFEWSSAPEDSNLHRNIIFRSNAVPSIPFSSFDSPNPRKLWDWLDVTRAGGMPVLAIPHNPNASRGAMFPVDNSYFGETVDASYAQQRMRNEPLVEVTQIKGTSETTPVLSSQDEWAGFEVVTRRIDDFSKESAIKGSYVRPAYRDGLVMQRSRGFNPYRFGMIGSSDSHNGATTAEEKHYTGKIGLADADPEIRLRSPEESGNARDFRVYSASGLAVVWAESNTREAIFDALSRKETYATSGPRIQLRFFAGTDFSPDIFTDPAWVAKAYREGIPMGGELSLRGDASPIFIVAAAKDASSANLQRLQIVKGWEQAGESFERVYDVACSDGLQPDPATHRCPDNGAVTDLKSCSFSRTGDVQLASVWRDPDFSAGSSAFYYVRALEDPSCRWTTWDANRLGMPPPDNVPAIIQERAYSSPVWIYSTDSRS